MEKALTKFSELRDIAQLIKNSLNSEHLRKSWRKDIQCNGINKYELIVLNESGYLSHVDDCQKLDECYYMVIPRKIAKIVKINS